MKALRTPIDVASHIADLIDFHDDAEEVRITVANDQGPHLIVTNTEGARFRVTVTAELPPKEVA